MARGRTASKPESAPSAQSITFNIIYSWPGGAGYFLPFISSLLESTECGYRLVANGCSAAERRRLGERCAQVPRLDFLDLSQDTVLEHGRVLDLLCEMETSDYFCFLDSDAFSRSDFVTELLPLLENYIAVFSAPPIWCEAQNRVLGGWPEIGGRHIYDSEGTCLGTTHLAMYHVRPLREFIAASGLTFRRYRWNEIPRQHHAALSAVGLRRAQYDTAKVLNIRLQQEAGEFTFLETESICHLGAMYEFFLDHRRSLRDRTIRRLRFLCRRLVRRARDLGYTIAARVVPSDAPRSQTTTRDYYRMLELRFAVSRYFFRLLSSLLENRDFDQRCGVEAQDLARRVEAVAEEIRRNWNQWNGES